MLARRIMRTQVQGAVDEPDVELPGNNPGTVRVHKRLNEFREVPLIYRPKKSVNLIITACWR